VERCGGACPFFFALSASLAARDALGQATDEDLRRIVADYVGLYRRETLGRWRELFLPSFTVASTNADGSVNLRTLEELYLAQKRYLDSGRPIEEKLQNIRVDRQGRMASVWADFVLTDTGEERRGRLVLLLIEERGGYRIHSLMFSYHG
jgi:hypothetical protein